MSKAAAGALRGATARAGSLYKYEATATAGAAGTWARLHSVLQGHRLLFFASDAKDEEVRESADLEDSTVASPDAGKVARRFAMDITTKSGVLYQLCADNREEHDAWLQAFAVASVPDAWPGGLDFNRRPQPLLYSMWVVQHTGSAASVGPAARRGGGGGGEGKEGGGRPPAVVRGGDPRVPSPFPKLPVLKSAPNWQRKGLLLQKLRQCSIAFDGVDPLRFTDDWEVKRNTLLEVVDYCDTQGRQLFSDFRVLDDTFTMLRLNLFRSLPRAPEPSGDPDEEELAFSDSQWPHLNIAYELLLRLVSMDHIDLAMKKRVIDQAFVRQLMLLFDSEDARERDYLKTITHRIYSKLTQRRALIRRVICYVFFEFVFETESHNGIAEILEILASIINGFAVPIKDEHRVMLVKALIPLHKAKTIVNFHPQLSYCMALYVAKDHVLTRDIVPGLLRHWPFGSSTKQIMFLNELEDVFEYVLDDDVATFRERLALRLAKCIGGLHFQVSERTLLLWNSERFAALLLDSPAHRPAVLRTLFPVLHENQQGHWHESIRTLSGSILDHYAEADPELVAGLREKYEAGAVSRHNSSGGGGGGGGGGGVGGGASDAAAERAAASSDAAASIALASAAASASASAASVASAAPSLPVGPRAVAGAGAPAAASAVPRAGASAGGVSGSLASISGASGGLLSRGLGGSLLGASLGGIGETEVPNPASPPGQGHGSPGQGGGGSGHRAPAVRASSSSFVSDNADLLPRGEHHRLGEAAMALGGASSHTPGKRPHGLGGLGMGLGMGLAMPSAEGTEE